MLEKIQSYVGNPLDPSAWSHRWIAGIIGDHPSQYAKSPSLWNPAFKALELDAIYLPFDLEVSNLSSFLEVFRESEKAIGFSVTVPYKVEIIKFLDHLDPKTAQIGAVNTVARTKDAKLVGYNTDGQGFMDMLTNALPGQRRPFFENIEGRQALLIGAGGAARAVAFYLAGQLGRRGHLKIAGRDPKKAKELATAVHEAHLNATYVAETDIGAVAPTVDLIINATTKGQSGMRRLADHRVTCLEPYSALAPAHPAELPQDGFSDDSTLYAAWYRQSYQDIEANHSMTNKILNTVPQETKFVDLIYSPLETQTLATARWSGHAVLNGKGMNICQAADAFVNRILRSHLTSMGWDLRTTYRRVFEIMSQVW
jgi:shikimate dehydrogenase